MSVKQQRNNDEQGKQKKPGEKDLSQNHLDHQKSHTKSLGTDPPSLCMRNLSYATASGHVR
jgi:hypothetical protein